MKEELMHKINMKIIKKWISDSDDFIKIGVEKEEDNVLSCRYCIDNKRLRTHEFYRNNPVCNELVILRERDSEYGDYLECYEKYYLGSHPNHEMYGFKEILKSNDLATIKKLVKQHNQGIFNREYDIIVGW